MFRTTAVLLLLALAFQAPRTPTASDAAITKRMHHLRCTSDREWSEFPERSEGPDLTLTFRSTASDMPRTLRVRHRDVKQSWRVLLNGTAIAALPADENDTITFWPVPPGTVKEGENELKVHCAANAADDVSIGEMTLIDGPRERVLSDATVDVSVVEDPGGRATPARITVVNEHGTLVSFGNTSGRDYAVRPGVVYVRSGPVRLMLPAGRYSIHAGRGFEYSVASTAVDLEPGASVSRTLTIRREVDSSGWAAMDTHVHTGTFARHGDASIEERMLTIAGEGIELPVSAEHDTRVDFDAYARAAGVRQHFTPLLGTEVTTPSLGHFNVIPLTTDSKGIDQRASDWGKLRGSIAGAAAEPIIVLNHGRDRHGGFRPLGRERHIGVAGENRDGWTLPATAMEVLNSGAVMTDALALAHDWMGLLNRGATLTPVGSSDSHDVSRYILGQGRTYVRSDDRDPGNIDLRQALESVRRGRVTVSYGLLAEIEVNGEGPGGLVDPKSALDVRIRVKGPGWTRAERVALYVNGVRVREEKIESGTKAGLKWEGTWRMPTPAHDVHVVAVASGPGLRAAYWPGAKPYQPTSIEFTPYVLGLSGAVFVDADGSGAFESAFEYARRIVASADEGLPGRLSVYDTAVAIQVASLLRAKDPARFEQTLRSISPRAPAHVADGFRAYLAALGS
jgi:hypothetical protein